MQTAMQGSAPETVQTYTPDTRNFRVDPYGGRQRIAPSDGVEVVLDDNGAVMKRMLRWGSAFHGAAEPCLSGHRSPFGRT